MTQLTFGYIAPPAGTLTQGQLASPVGRQTLAGTVAADGSAESTVAQALSTSRWCGMGFKGSAPSITEANNTRTLDRPQVVTAIYLVVTANATSGASTVTLQKNGADTALTFSIGAGATGTFSDTAAAHAVTYAAGDTWSLKVTSGAGGNLTYRSWSCDRYLS